MQNNTLIALQEGDVLYDIYEQVVAKIRQKLMLDHDGPYKSNSLVPGFGVLEAAQTIYRDYEYYKGELDKKRQDRSLLSPELSALVGHIIEYTDLISQLNFGQKQQCRHVLELTHKLLSGLPDLAPAPKYVRNYLSLSQRLLKKSSPVYNILGGTMLMLGGAVMFVIGIKCAILGLVQAKDMMNHALNLMGIGRRLVKSGVVMMQQPKATEALRKTYQNLVGHMHDLATLVKDSPRVSGMQVEAPEAEPMDIESPLTPAPSLKRRLSAAPAAPDSVSPSDKKCKLEADLLFSPKGQKRVQVQAAEQEIKRRRIEPEEPEPKKAL